MDEYPETDLTRGVKELCEALPAYEKAEAYYDGDVEEIFANDNIARYIGRTRNRYRLNFSKMVVNVLADRLEISSVVVPTSTDLTKLINKIYRKNRMHRKSRTIIRRTTMFGDAYLFVWPENPDAPNIKFEVYYNSPKTTRVIYDREQPDKPAFAIKMWQTPSPLGASLMVYRVNLYYPNQIEKYISNQKAKTPTTATSYYPSTSTPTPQQQEAPLDPDQWDHIETVPNPYDTIPIFHFRNDEPYGSPRHKDGYGAQDALNKLSTTLVHTADFQGFPQRYGLADPNAQIGGEGDDTSPAPWSDEDAALDDTDSRIESGPGTFITLRGIRAAGSFPAAPPNAFMDPARFYLRSMAQITVTPLRFFDPMGEPPSGEALRAMDAPLDKEAQDFQDMLEEPFADVHEFFLRVLNKNTVPKQQDATKDPDDPDKEVQVDIQWKPTHTIDDSVGWTTIQTKIKTGVPAKQALTEAGYSQAQVEAWLNKNENRALLDHDSEMLSRISLSAANLSKAVDSKVLDPNIAQHIITSLLNRLLNEKLREPTIKETPVIITNQPQPPLPTDRQGEPDGRLLDKPAQGSPAEGSRASAEAARRLAPLPDKQLQGH